MERKKKEYIKISTTILIKANKALAFDLYIQRAPGKFTKIFHNGDLINQEQLQKYQSEKNVMYLYVHHEEADSYFSQVEDMVDSAFGDGKGIRKEEIRTILNEMTGIALDEIYERVDVSEKALRWAEKVVHGCTEVMEKDFAGLLKIVKLFSSRPYHMKHALMVSVFSVMLAKGLDYESEKTLRSIGLGGFMHDVGLTRLTEEVATKVDLTPEEWKEKKQHPELGVMILDSIPSIPSEVRQIVLQHHEQPNGHGYPNGLHGREIFQMAKIVAIADAFTDLITSTPEKPAEFDPVAALKRMEEDIGKYDMIVLKVFKKVILPGKPIQNGPVVH